MQQRRIYLLLFGVAALLFFVLHERPPTLTQAHKSVPVPSRRILTAPSHRMQSNVAVVPPPPVGQQRSAVVPSLESWRSSKELLAHFAEPPPVPPPPPRAAPPPAHSEALPRRVTPPLPPPSMSRRSSSSMVERAWQRLAGTLSELLPPPPPTTAETTTQRDEAHCRQLRSQHTVVIGVSWGSLPASGQLLWTRMQCDALLRGLPTTARVGTGGADGSDPWLRAYRERHTAALATRPSSRRIARSAGEPRRLTLAVCACTTSRGMRKTQLDDFTLFSLMLPSLLRTFGSSSGGSGGGDAAFELWVYIAFDAGDAFYDVPEREVAVRAWLDEHMVVPLNVSGVRVRHALLRFDNVLRKPGPAFNFMMAAAAEDGADYLYRVNDDTEFVGDGWLSQAVRTLRSYSPANVGVVGPVCHEGNTRILTHDLVHRTHLSIFEHYYPPILSDWWMDDWISHVYGPRRTTKGPFLVRHHVGVHGTRYAVDQAHEARLAGELEAGRHALQRYLARPQPPE